MWVSVWLLLGLILGGRAWAQTSPVVPYPRDYKGSLVKYAVVDRVDGFSRDLYVSRDALDAVKRDPQLKELPAGALLALDVHRARSLGRDRKTGASRFEASPDGHLIRAKDERILHKLPGDCLLCHQAAVVSDMTFSMSLLKRFAATGAVQYGFCGHPGRQSCAFP